MCRSLKLGGEDADLQSVHYIDIVSQTVHYIDVVFQTVHYIDIVFQNVSS